jgi:hypothetical protein
MASPRHLQPQHATTTTTTVQIHELRGKLAIGSTLGPFISIFVHPDTVTRPLPLHTIKGEGGILDKKEARRKTTPSNGNVLSTHPNTRTHPLTETWEPSLSRPACIPLLQALRCKATRALDVGTFGPNQYTSCVRLAHHRRLRCATSFTCPVSRHPPVLEHRSWRAR